MPLDIPQSTFGEELPKEAMRNTIVVECENEGKQLHRAAGRKDPSKTSSRGEFTWHSDEPPQLGGDDNHPQPLTYLTGGIGQ